MLATERIRAFAGHFRCLPRFALTRFASPTPVSVPLSFPLLGASPVECTQVSILHAMLLCFLLEYSLALRNSFTSLMHGLSLCDGSLHFSFYASISVHLNLVPSLSTDDVQYLYITFVGSDYAFMSVSCLRCPICMTPAASAPHSLYSFVYHTSFLFVVYIRTVLVYSVHVGSFHSVVLSTDKVRDFCTAFAYFTLRYQSLPDLS